MNQDIAHIYYIALRNIGMTQAEISCQQIGSFAYYHDVINHSMKAHDVCSHVFERLLLEERIDMLYAFINMVKAVYVSNSFSHK